MDAIGLAGRRSTDTAAAHAAELCVVEPSPVWATAVLAKREAAQRAEACQPRRAVLHVCFPSLPCRPRTGPLALTVTQRQDFRREMGQLSHCVTK